MVHAFDIRPLWFVVLLAACSAAPPLNSDRIEERFGSYGVQILSAGDTTRVSCLYSEEPDGRTCRTVAVVEFMGPLPESAAAVHARVEAGASIGAAFRDAGWHIRKSHHRVYSAPLPAHLDRYAPLMKIDAGTELATHRYWFQIRRHAGWLAYAAITEMHHPDYLTEGDLTAAYARD